LAQLSGDQVRVLWTFHHVLLDGWSVFQVLSDVFARYAELVAGQPAQPVARRPFREYLAWLAEQPAAEAQEFWRRVLRGFVAPTPLPYDRTPGAAHTTHSSE